MSRLLEKKKVFLENRKAFHDYFIEEKLEAGIELQGSEVKSIREGRAQLADAYVVCDGGQVFLYHFKIQEYTKANHFNHAVERIRRLLLKKKQVHYLDTISQRKGYTIIPLEVYSCGPWIKLTIGIAKGKKLYDKRETEKAKTAKREIDRESIKKYKNTR